MKVCPVCKSLCFDDMPVCYECMHGFDRGTPCAAEGERPSEGDVDRSGRQAPSSDAGAASAVGSDGVVERLGVSPQRPHEPSSYSNGPSRRCDDGIQTTASLRIPMVTSVLPRTSASDSASRELHPRRSGASHEAAPFSCLTIEAPAGCRVVLRVESA